MVRPLENGPVGRLQAAINLAKFFDAFSLNAEMFDAFTRMIARRDREIDPRVVEHPLGIILFHDGRLGAKHRRIEADRGVEIFDADMDMQALHALFLSGAGASHAAPAPQSAAPAQQFSMRYAISAFIAG